MCWITLPISPPLCWTANGVSFFLFRAFTIRAENVCQSSVTVRKENNFLCTVSKRGEKPGFSRTYLKTFSSHISGCGFQVWTFSMLYKQNWYTHTLRWIMIFLGGFYHHFLFMWICVKEKKTFCNNYLQFKNQ